MRTTLTDVDAVPPRDLLNRVAIAPGHDVLDVATGTGGVAVRAAAAGARVIGLDRSPALLAMARRRAAEYRVSVAWLEGEPEGLPFADGSFDHVFSAFGVQFAPRHEAAAAELARVCRPAGVVGLVSWTPGGAIGELLAIADRHRPAPPPFAPSSWGSEDHVRRLFARTGVDLGFARGHNPWRFPSAEAWIAFLEAAHGPLATARRQLLGAGRWAACRDELVACAERRNEATDGTLLVRAEYLVAVGAKGW